VFIKMVVVRIFPEYGVRKAEERFRRNPSAENEDFLWRARNRITKEVPEPAHSHQEAISASFNALTNKIEILVRSREEAKEVATHMYNKGMSDYIGSLYDQGVSKVVDDIDLSYLPDRTKNFISNIKQQQKELFSGGIDFDDLVKDNSDIDFFELNDNVDSYLGAIGYETKLGVTLALVNKIVNDWGL
ncbi:hypothetical protein MGU62_004537, partial [Salmonella enterica]|nr:hypothetical protein [Salmonella enterica]